MGKTIMGGGGGFPDGFIADESDEVGPLFDRLGSGDVSWSPANGEKPSDGLEPTTPSLP